MKQNTNLLFSVNVCFSAHALIYLYGCGLLNVAILTVKQPFFLQFISICKDIIYGIELY